MKLLKLLLLLFLISCGTEQISLPRFKQNGYINPELKPFVEEFSKTFNVVVNITVKFDNEPIENYDKNKLEEYQLGVCYNYNIMNLDEVIISYTNWNSFTSNRYNLGRFLITHELTHCVFNYQGHNDDRKIVGELDVPVSIMTSAVTSEEIDFINNNWEYYINNLKGELNYE
ncbi:MAG: hypothetical protein EHM87_24675 [Burkholderiales bacterium]|nr:MAG: hypothetical protein EHM87_24675 [Burkholderiales bacterium]